MSGAKFWLIASGLTLIFIGVLIRWRTGRYDLKDAALESAWMLARGRRTAENPTALEAKFNEIRSQPTWTGIAAQTARTGIGHFAAQALGVAALVLILVGFVLMVFGFFWG